jgi:hypothetical protein
MEAALVSERFIRIEIDRAGMAELARKPEKISRAIGSKLERAALEVGREAKRLAPKAFSTLAQSILHERLSPFAYRVGPHVEYGRYVEEGTGRGGVPPVRSMLDWIKVHRISPNDPAMTPEDLAFVMARSIASKGTPAQPYLVPAAKTKESRVIALVRAGIAEALA